MGSLAAPLLAVIIMSFETIAVDTSYRLLGKDATYTPDGGSAAAIKIMVRQPDQIVDIGSSQILTETTLMELRVSEVADPNEGDVITYDSVNYVVDSEPKREDSARLVWTLNVRPQ